MKTLVYDTNSFGHHLEYIYHIYIYAGTRSCHRKFTFVLSYEFKLYDQFKYLPYYDNVEISFIPSKIIKKLHSRSKLLSSLKQTCLLFKYIRKIDPDKVVINSFVEFMPFLAFVINRKSFISGVLYIIPRHKSWKVSVIKKIIDFARMFIYAKSPIFENVFLLNDVDSPDYYNKLYHSTKFSYLVDPFVPILDIPLKIKHLTFPKEKIKFLHFGGMGERKGTFTILSAIRLLNDKYRSKALFIFAGVISDPEMHKLFIDEIEKLSNEVNIYFREGFIPFPELGFICEQSDYILVPYKNVAQSSGVIGYAAQFGKPVIGPNDGLLGKLINSYEMGITLSKVDAATLASTFENIISGNLKIEINSKRYLEVATPENFAEIILNDKIQNNFVMQI